MRGTLVADDELIDLIYGALLGESDWQQFLDRLAASAEGGWAVMFSHDLSRNDASIGLFAGRDAAVAESYEGYYAAVNPWAPGCVAKPPGFGVVSDDLVARETLVATEFFNDFLAPNDMQAAAGVSVIRDEARFFMISTLTNVVDPDAVRPIADQMTRLAPHLRRAMEFYRRGAGEAWATELGPSLLDSIDTGVVVMGEDRRAKAVSRSAEAMLVAGAPLAFSPGGRLSIKDGAADTLLSAMLARDYAGPKSASFPVGAMRLTFVHIRKDLVSLLFEGPTVIVLMQPASPQPSRVDIEAVAVRYGLTLAETRALTGVARGFDVDRIAREANRSRETIRSQIKSVYAKTDAHGEAALLRLLHGNMP